MKHHKKVVLSLTEALHHGWQATSQYIGFYVTLVFLIILLNLIPSVSDAIFNSNSIYSGAIRGICVLLIALVTLGMIRTSIKSDDKKEPNLIELFHTKRFVNYFLASVVYLGLFVGGLILFIVPGFYWALKYQFATYIVAEEDVTIAQAFHDSAVLVRGHEWDLFGYWLIMFLMNMVGLLFFGIGIIITLPITVVGYSYLYRQLRDA